MSQHPNRVLAVAALSLGLLVAIPAGAASMAKVNQSDWQGGVSLPSYVNMYIYVPATKAAKPPIVVGPHHCGGTAQSSDSEMGSLKSVADSTGFIIIFPEATGQNCWDAGSPKSMKHDGGGDTQAIAQMVKYTLSKYGGDASRVYSVGASSGGIMTEALLGVYPDVFMAGVSMMGVPCGCWAASYNNVVGKPADGTGQWSSPCAGGTVSKTGQQWGDLVRSYFSTYTGHRPRLQHWHGTADATLDYKNLAEDIKEWTNVLGLSETPTGSDTPTSGTTRKFWKNSCGYTVYEAFSVSGAGHTLSVDGPAVAAYFGIDKKDSQDPEAVACPSTGGTGGTGGGGSAGAGGTTGVGTGGRDGGLDRGDAAIPGSGGAYPDGSTGTGGVAGTGGHPGSGGTSAEGGTSGRGGAVGSGGTSNGSGGVLGSGGMVGNGGSSAKGGNPGSGGIQGKGGTDTQGGTSGSGGALANVGGTTMANSGKGGSSTSGSSGSGGSSTTDGGNSSGFGCRIGSSGGPTGTLLSAGLLAMVLGLRWKRTRRRR